MVFKESLIFVLLLFSISLIFYMFVWAVIYKPIRYCYGKPKYRRNKEGYIEYFDYMRNHWELLTVWDKNETNRKFVLYSEMGTPIEINYKGPGRQKIYIDCNMSQKGFRNEFIFKTTKEINKYIEEQINNEDIIISKVLHDKVKYTI